MCWERTKNILINSINYFSFQKYFCSHLTRSDIVHNVYSAQSILAIFETCFRSFFPSRSNSWLAHEIHSSLHYFYILWKMLRRWMRYISIKFRWMLRWMGYISAIYDEETICVEKVLQKKHRILAHFLLPPVFHFSLSWFWFCFRRCYAVLLLNTSSCRDQWQPFNRSYFSRNRKEQHTQYYINHQRKLSMAKSEVK